MLSLNLISLPDPLKRMLAFIVRVSFTSMVEAKLAAPSTSKISRLDVPSTSMSPAKATVVVPVAILKTVASASFLTVTSVELPCPVSIRPSAAV